MDKVNCFDVGIEKFDLSSTTFLLLNHDNTQPHFKTLYVCAFKVDLLYRCQSERVVNFLSSCSRLKLNSFFSSSFWVRICFNRLRKS